MKEIVLKVPGRPVPYVRTTQKGKYIDRQYRRYEIYKAVVRLTYIIDQLGSQLTFMPRHKAIMITALKQQLTVYRDTLMRTINRCEDAVRDEYTIIKIEAMED